MPHGSSGAAAGLRASVFFNVRIPANVAQIKFKLEVNSRRGGGGGGEGARRGGDCFHFKIPPLHSAETNIANSRRSPTAPTLAVNKKLGRGACLVESTWGLGSPREEADPGTQTYDSSPFAERT
jgi:hypothetical protein